MRRFDQRNAAKGQSAIEYLLLWAAVITVLIVFLNPSGPFRGVVEQQSMLPPISWILWQKRSFSLRLNFLNSYSYGKDQDEFRRKKIDPEISYEQKFQDVKKKISRSDSLYLRNRLQAIEQAIKYLFGLKELKVIQSLYEEEMTRRILEAREHH